MDTREMMIWITGVVGRSMGSGKFEAADIPRLTKEAYNAWAEILEPLVASAPPAPPPPPPRPASAPTRHSTPQRSSAPQGAVNPNVTPESKPWDMWQGDKAYYGKKEWKAYGVSMPEISWGEWVRNAQQGDEKAIKALRHMASSQVSSGEWADRDRRKIGRAIACLNLVTGGSDENTPF